MTTASTRSVLAGLNPNNVAVYLVEAGREGDFVWSGSNLSSKVSADAAQGIYVAKSNDSTGASGAWVRKFSGAHNVRWFGATGDGTTNDGSAFTAALTYLASEALSGYGYSQGIPELFVPKGHYYLGTTTLDLTYTIRLTGEGVGAAGGAVSLLRWAAGATGIRTQRTNTTGATGTQSASGHGGDGSIIAGLFLQGGYAGTEGEYYGIHLRAKAEIRDCYVKNFQGDGIYIVATTGGSPEGNANNFEVRKCRVEACRNGIYLDGGDVNAGTIAASEFDINRQWGINDSSFLGNSYLSCHVAANGWDGASGSIPTASVYSGNRYAVKVGQAAGASTNAPSGTTADNTWWLYIAPGTTYSGVVAWVSGTTFREGGAFKTDDSNAQNVFIGCYSEGDQNPAQITGPTLVIGGLHGAKVKGTGAYLKGSGTTFTVENGNIGARNSIGTIATTIDPDYPIKFFHSSYGSAEYSLQWYDNSLIYTYANSQVSTNWAFELTGETTIRSIGSRRLNFPNGFGLNNKKVLNGTAAPASGTYVQGDMVVNSAPTAGNPMGWMCVSGGSPGTWKAMANLAA